jgi:TorA maturation chaperone TorD
MTTPASNTPHGQATGAIVDSHVADHAARALAYRALSALITSPANEPWTAVSVRSAIDELQQAAALLSQSLDLSALELVVDDLTPISVAAAARDYGSQFEVGERGPPLPIRAELAPNANPALKEELARFFEHFGYEVAERDAWQLDHLAVILEFLHYLAFCGVRSDAADDLASLSLGAKDVLSRHVLPWVPQMNEQLQRGEASTLVRAIVATIASFTAADHAWLAAQETEE